jgi:hypothetical protein
MQAVNDVPVRDRVNGGMERDETEQECEFASEFGHEAGCERSK